MTITVVASDISFKKTSASNRFQITSFTDCSVFSRLSSISTTATDHNLGTEHCSSARGKKKFGSYLSLIPSVFTDKSSHRICQTCSVPIAFWIKYGLLTNVFLSKGLMQVPAFFSSFHRSSLRLNDLIQFSIPKKAHFTTGTENVFIKGSVSMVLLNSARMARFTPIENWWY